METCRSQVLNLTNCPWSQVNPLNSTELRHQHVALKTTLARGEEGIELKAAIGATGLLMAKTENRWHWAQKFENGINWGQFLLIHFDIRHTFLVYIPWLFWMVIYEIYEIYIYIYLCICIPWAPKTMKHKGFGHLKTRLFTINKNL